MASGRHITAREFEFIVPRRIESANCHNVGPEDFTTLREFVLANREGDSPLDLMRLCSPKGIGEALQLQNYVGVIELRDGLQIEVLPKIDIEPSSKVTVRDIFAQMLAELGSDVPFKVFDRAALSTRMTSLLEVFISMFLGEVANLVRRGIRPAYVTVESEERFVRGKIDFAKETKKGPERAHALNLIHDELLPNRPENRIIKTTLLRLRNTSRNGENIRKATRLLPAFECVSESHDIETDLARCVDDRSTRGYTTIIAWCRIFLRGESFTMFRGDNVAMALLFPMERMFEDYVGRLLKKRAARDGSLQRVVLQAKGQWLFEGKRVSLRPDILCERHDGHRVILDTKWKRVNGPKDLSVADMYQMYAYGQRYRAEDEPMQRVVLLFPWHEGVETRLLPNGRHVSKDGVQVDMFFVDLANMPESLDALLGYIMDTSI